MKKQEANIKIWKLILLIVPIILIIIGIPFLIIILNKNGSILTYSIDGILSYIGAFLGAIATIIAVTITIRFTAKQQKNDRKLAIKPYLTTKIKSCTFKEFANKDTNNILYTEITAKSNIVPYVRSKKPPYFFAPEKLARTDIIKSEYSIPQFNKNIYFIEYLITNIGAGNALNLDINICGWPMSLGHVPVNDTISLRIRFNIEPKDLEYNCRIKLEYEDVASIAKYNQYEHFSFVNLDSSGVSFAQVGNDILTKPEEIKKEG